MKITGFIIFIFFKWSAQQAEPPSPKIEILTLTDCEDVQVSPPNDFKVEASLEGEGATKKFNAKATLPFDFDNSIKYRASIKRWEENKWKAIPLRLSGSVCEHGPKYMPGIWANLAKALNIPPQCPVKAGSYTISNFEASSQDVKAPFVVEGKYLISATVLKDDVPIMCKQSEITLEKL